MEAKAAKESKGHMAKCKPRKVLQGHNGFRTTMLAGGQRGGRSQTPSHNYSGIMLDRLSSVAAVHVAPSQARRKHFPGKATVSRAAPSL